MYVIYINPVQKMFITFIEIGNWYYFKTLTLGCSSIHSTKLALFLFSAPCWHNQLTLSFLLLFTCKLGRKENNTFSSCALSSEK